MSGKRARARIHTQMRQMDPLLCSPPLLKAEASLSSMYENCTSPAALKRASPAHKATAEAKSEKRALAELRVVRRALLSSSALACDSPTAPAQAIWGAPRWDHCWSASAYVHKRASWPAPLFVSSWGRA